MRDTDQKAKSGMIKFVIAIFTIAVVLALGYLVFLTPGETTPTTISTQQCSAETDPLASSYGRVLSTSLL